MKYADLTPTQQREIVEIIDVFRVDEMVYLNKMEMGQAISARVNATGQDGEAFVHHVYSVSVNENPLAAMNPPLWLLCSFLSTLCRTVLRKHGYNATNTEPDEFLELAQDLVDMAEQKAESRG
jgi:hypothetical protein